MDPGLSTFTFNEHTLSHPAVGPGPAPFGHYDVKHTEGRIERASLSLFLPKEKGASLGLSSFPFSQKTVGRHIHTVHTRYTGRHREAYGRYTPPTNPLREAYGRYIPPVYTFWEAYGRYILLYTPSGRHMGGIYPVNTPSGRHMGGLYPIIHPRGGIVEVIPCYTPLGAQEASLCVLFPVPRSPGGLSVCGLFSS